MKKIWEWLGPHKTVRFLQLEAIIRNICQNIVVVDVTLYLKDLGRTGGAIRGLLVGAGLVRTAITSFAGELNVRLGPKFYMIVYESITAAAALVMTLTDNNVALCSAVTAAGFGRGHTGSGSLITPIQRGWLTAYSRSNANHIFGINALLGCFGMGIGCIIASLPPLWKHWLPDAQEYRSLFALIFILTLVCIFVIANVTGGKRKHPKVR